MIDSSIQLMHVRLDALKGFPYIYLNLFLLNKLENVLHINCLIIEEKKSTKQKKIVNI